MARTQNLLTAKGVTGKGPGRWRDGNGLFLVVRESGARSWILEFSYLGKPREMGLGVAGPPPAIPLAAARDLAREAKATAKAGIDPVAVRTTRREEVIEASKPAAKFGEFADAYIVTNRSGWRGKKTEARWKLIVERYAAPIRAKALDAITTDDVLAILAPIWTEKPELATKAQNYLERLFDAAKAKGVCKGENPARWRGHLQHLLPKRSKLTRGHHKSLAYAEAPAFMAALRKRRGVAAHALEFTILTGTRTAEVAGARWSEIDFDGAIWNVPLERTKAAEALHQAGFTVFRVALSKPALALLKALRETSEQGGEVAGTDYVFPGPGGGELSNGGMERVLDRMKVEATVHGFRSTFRTWAGAQVVTLPDGSEVDRFKWEAMESALGHVVGKPTERAYARDDYLRQRVHLMAAWADYLAGAKAGSSTAPIASSAQRHLAA